MSRQAFEQLVAQELVTPTITAATATWRGTASAATATWAIPAHAAGLREYVPVSLQVDAEQVAAAVKQRADCPLFLRQWAVQWDA
jgi:hypothetical protein